MDWIHGEHQKHPFLTDIGEAGVAAAGILATGGIADLAMGAAGAAGNAVTGAVGDVVISIASLSSCRISPFPTQDQRPSNRIAPGAGPPLARAKSFSLSRIMNAIIEPMGDSATGSNS
jgi:hypothetical protein